MPHGSVVVSYNGERRQVASGTVVEQFLASVHGSVPEDILAALVNRRLVMLDFPLRGLHVELQAVRYGTREGESVARRSTVMILLAAVV